MVCYICDDLNDLVGKEAVRGQVGFDVHVKLAQSFGKLGKGSAASGFECYGPSIAGEARRNILEFGKENAIDRFGILIDGIAALTIDFIGVLLLRGADRC